MRLNILCTAANTKHSLLLQVTGVNRIISYGDVGFQLDRFVRRVFTSSVHATVNAARRPEKSVPTIMQKVDSPITMSEKLRMRNTACMSHYSDSMLTLALSAEKKYKLIEKL